MAKILIVEDYDQLAKLVVLLCETLGHECITALDGQEAIDLLPQQKFDLVVLDMMLPRRSGLEVLDVIRETQSKGIHVIISSADWTGLKQADEESVVKVQKPYKISELSKSIEELVGRV